MLLSAFSDTVVNWLSEKILESGKHRFEGLLYHLLSLFFIHKKNE